MAQAAQPDVTVPCMHCGAPVLGTARFCGGCGRPLAMGAEVPEPEPEPVEEPPSPAKLALVGVGAALALFAFAAAIYLQVSGGGEDPGVQALTRPRSGAALSERFFVGDWTAQQGVLGTVVLGEVRNDNTVAAGVKVQIIAYDGRGNVIDTTEYWPAGTANIEVGASARLDLIATSEPAVTFEVRVIDARIW